MRELNNLRSIKMLEEAFNNKWYVPLQEWGMRVKQIFFLQLLAMLFNYLHGLIFGRKNIL